MECKDAARLVLSDCYALTCMRAPVANDRLVNVDKEIRRGRLLKCAACGKPGAAIGCAVKSCKNTFHLACAGAAGCWVSGYSLRCAAHSAQFLKSRFARLTKDVASTPPGRRKALKSGGGGGGGDCVVTPGLVDPKAYARGEYARPHCTRVRDLLLKKADEFTAYRGEDEDSLALDGTSGRPASAGDGKQKSEGKKANEKKRMTNLMKKFQSDPGWRDRNQRSPRKSAVAAAPQTSVHRGATRVAPKQASGRSRGAERKANLAVVPKSKPLPPLPPVRIDDFVDVRERSVPGAFKEGGRARVIRDNGDGTYNVKMIVGKNIDKNVPRVFLTPVESAAADDDGASGSDADENAESLRNRRSRRGAGPDPGFEPGTKVIVNCNTRYYAARVLEATSKGRYRVRFAGGCATTQELHHRKFEKYSQRALDAIRAREPWAVIFTFEAAEKAAAAAVSTTRKRSANGALRIARNWRAGLSTGDKLEVWDRDEDSWKPSEVVADEDNRIRVHFIGYPPKYDIWLPRDSRELRRDETTMSFRVLGVGLLARPRKGRRKSKGRWRPPTPKGAGVQAKQWQIEALASLENVFSWQLPSMPPGYITKLLYDPNHQTLCLVKEKQGGGQDGIVVGGGANMPAAKRRAALGPAGAPARVGNAARAGEFASGGTGDGSGLMVIGGVTYRPFYELGFAEVVFCAVVGHEQVRGCGTQLMSHLKEHLGKDGITHFITYADDGAIGFFKKQGFSRELSIPREKFEPHITQYSGGTLMDCRLSERGVDRLYHGLGSDQNVSGGVYPPGARVEVQFLDSSKASLNGRKWVRAKILKSETDDEGGVRYFVHYMGWKSKWDQWTVPEHIRPDLSADA